MCGVWHCFVWWLTCRKCVCFVVSFNCPRYQGIPCFLFLFCRRVIYACAHIVQHVRKIGGIFTSPLFAPVLELLTVMHSKIRLYYVHCTLITPHKSQFQFKWSDNWFEKVFRVQKRILRASHQHEQVDFLEISKLCRVDFPHHE